MLILLFLLFTLVPLVELALLVWIGVNTVWWVPIGLVLLTGIAGAALARWQGWETGTRIRGEVRARRLPADALIDGFLIIIAAILLIAPGVITDVAGLLLLLPPTRRAVKRAALNWLRRQIEMKATQFHSSIRPDVVDHPIPKRHDEIIEAKVIATRVEDAV